MRHQDIFRLRIFIASAVIALVFIIIIARIYTLQVVHYEQYSKQALGNSLTLRPIVPARGKIFDRNGILLASNALSYKLTIIPNKVRNIQQALQQLQQQGFITKQHIENFTKTRKYFTKFQNIVLREDLTPQEVARFLVSNTLDGVELIPYFYRIYTEPTLNAHILGYVAKMNVDDKQEYSEDNYKGTEFVGKIGIEKQYERILHGTRGVKQIERDVRGRILNEKIIVDSQAGKDLYLSIDSKLQRTAQQSLKHMRGSIVMLDVRTGEVLAMYSAPSFDNNLFTRGISNEEYQQLNTDKNLPLFNRSIKGTYPPGSTIKPMVALVGLETGVIHRHHTVFCPGHYKLPNYSRIFNDWNRNGHGEMSVSNSIAQSCDVFYYDLARKMGIDALHNGLSLFDLGKITGIDLPGEEPGVLPSKEWKQIHKKEPWYQGETLITGIGQGFMTTTPLQLAHATAIIASYGRKITPTLIKGHNSPSVQLPVKDSQNWDLVIEGMKKTIYDPKGTARRLNKGLQYTLAGKTGTAQVFGLDPEEKYIAEKYAEHLRDHALFIGFAPIETPEVAISVIVENAGSGSAVAAPIARKMLDAYFAQKTNK